jgi:hypothetical protein
MGRRSMAVTLKPIRWRKFNASEMRTALPRILVAVAGLEDYAGHSVSEVGT